MHCAWQEDEHSSVCAASLVAAIEADFKPTFSEIRAQELFAGYTVQTRFTQCVAEVAVSRDEDRPRHTQEGLNQVTVVGLYRQSEFLWKSSYVPRFQGLTSIGVSSHVRHIGSRDALNDRIRALAQTPRLLVERATFDNHYPVIGGRELFDDAEGFRLLGRSVVSRQVMPQPLVDDEDGHPQLLTDRKDLMS